MAQRRYELSQNANTSQILQNQIAVKLKLGSFLQRGSVDDFFQSIDAIKSSAPLRNPTIQARSGPSVLDGVFIIQIEENKDPIELCNQLLRHQQVEYAEVMYQQQLFQTPDDPFANPSSGSQGYLGVISAYEAWDITTGSSDIVIGIVDTGMDLTHEDIIGKYYVNPVEVVNGLDDDNNGYVDDILGYDFADIDTDAQADGSQHGTHVGGIAGANTNNGLGIASVGYECLLSPLKGFTTVGQLSTGVWEGVLYAADNGYDIVNLSWGNFGGFNQFDQDIINYCVLEKDMVVIAAAGNTPADLDFYPASYEHVLSVGASTLSDTKWSSGTYSDHIDVMAPGLSIFSTQNDDTYNTDSGSSHSTPQVAGAAGLVKSVFPEYNARQIMEQLRVTSDDIYGVSGNEAFAFKLGKGRLNAFRAVSESVSRSLRVHDFDYASPFGNYAFFGDTLTLSYDLTNYLANLISPSLGLESESPYVQILTTATEFGAFATMQTKSQGDLQIVLTQDAPPNTEIDLRFTMNEGSYSDFQNVSFFTEPDEFDFGDGNMSLKVVGDGSIGFSTSDYSTGLSMGYNGESVMTFSGLILGENAASLNDNVTNDFSVPTREDDFQSEKAIKLLPHDVIPFYGYSEFSSMDGNLWIEQSIIPSEDESYLVIQYRIINTSGAELVDFEAGFFADYNLDNQTDNHANWDSSLNSLVFNDDVQSTYASVGLIESVYHYAALDMQALNGNSKDINATFTDTEKFDFMAGINIPNAGTEGVGNDVAGLVNSTFSSIQPNESVKITVSLTLADSYSKLTSIIAIANTTYQSFQSNPPLEEVFFTCAGNDLTIDPTNGTSYNFYEDPLGQDFIQTGSQLILPNVTEDTVIYISNLDGAFPTDTKRLDIRLVNQISAFSLSVDTLYLDDPDLNPVSFIDESFLPISWQWDFGIGDLSTAQNPVVNFTEAGTYQIRLTAQSSIGCGDQISKDLVVANRPPTPTLDDFIICKNETIDLLHPTDEYVVYNENGLQVQSGPNLVLGPFALDTTLLIAQKISGFESLTQEVFVATDLLEATFAIFPDTLAAGDQALFVYSSGNADSYEWRVDGMLEGTESTLSFQASTAEIVVELTVQNSACEDTQSSIVSFETSQIPTISDLVLCLGEDALIAPENGIFFGFYSDDQLTNLISKGTSLLLSNVSQSTTIYITGLDDVLPSAPVSVTISIENFQPAILAEPAILNLSLGNTVRLSSSDPSITSAEWYLDGILSETEIEPILLFDSAGTYEIKLVATNSSGCTFEISSQFIVSTVTGIDEPYSASIYPNPASKYISIESNFVIETIGLFNIAGEKIMKKSIYAKKITFEPEVSPGLYFIELITSGSKSLHKIKIQ